MSELEDLFAIQCESSWAIPPFKREIHFDLERKWRLDFAWPEHGLAIEIEGGTWAGSRHVTGGGFQEDCRKYNTAVYEGFRLMRFTAEMVREGEALRQTELWFERWK